MLKLCTLALVTFLLAPLSLAQAPPPPPAGDFPHPMPPEGKKKTGKRAKDMTEPKHKGIKPPMPTTPPTPESTAPDEPDIN